MSSPGRLALLASVVVVVWCVWAAPAGAYVYWGNFDSIGRANLDGSAPVQDFIAADPETAGGVAVDDRRIYWGDRGSGGIGRANLDGTGVNRSFIAGVSFPGGVAVDGQHVYWANVIAGAIGRANLDGSGVIHNFITGLASPAGVAVDGKHIYWANDGFTTIGRANLDGTGANQNFITGVSDPRGVAVDGEHVYWTDAAGGTVGRANLDGSNPDAGFIVGATFPTAVAVDGEHVYWADAAPDTIGRAGLDGSDVNHAFISGARDPVAVAVDGGPAGTASPSTTSLGFGIQPLGTFGAPAALTITNTGHGNLDVEAARVTGAAVDDFLVSHDTCTASTLPVGDTCTVGVRFGPGASGARSATLAVTSNDPASPLRIALDGTAGQLPQGPQGPSGSPGPRFDRLALALATDRVRARPRQRVRLRYAITMPAAIELRVLSGRRRVARVRADADAGRNTIRLRAPRRARSYRVRVIATTGDGQRVTDRVRLTVTRGGG